MAATQGALSPRFNVFGKLHPLDVPLIDAARLLEPIYGLTAFIELRASLIRLPYETDGSDAPSSVTGEKLEHGCPSVGDQLNKTRYVEACSSKTILLLTRNDARKRAPFFSARTSEATSSVSSCQEVYKQDQATIDSIEGSLPRFPRGSCFHVQNRLQVICAHTRRFQNNYKLVCERDRPDQDPRPRYARKLHRKGVKV